MKIVLVLIGVVWIWPVQAGLIFFSGAESAWNKSRTALTDDSWGDDETHVPFGHAYAVTQETSHNGVSPRAGNKMWKLEIRSGDTGSGGNCRNTLEQYFPKGQREYWIGYSMYFPSGFLDAFPTTDSTSSYPSGSVTGMGGEDPAGGYPDGFDASTRYGMRVQSKGGDPAYLYPYQKDKIFLADRTDRWLDFVFHFTTGDSSSDYYEYWLDGQFQGHWDGTLWPTNRLPGPLPDGQQMNYKVGQYYCSSSTNIFYFDEFKVWEGSGGSYDAVAPGGGSPPPPTDPQCNDTLDNDSDGQTDYPDDPGCVSATDDDETDPPPDATAEDCHRITAPTNLQRSNLFAPPYDVHDASQPLLVKTVCDADSVNVTIGDGAATTYIYKQIYTIKRTNAYYGAIDLTGTYAPQTTDWYQGSATVSLPRSDYDLTRQTDLLTYICQRQADNSYKCGCSETACLTHKWQLQTFSETP